MRRRNYSNYRRHNTYTDFGASQCWKAREESNKKPHVAIHVISLLLGLPFIIWMFTLDSTSMLFPGIGAIVIGLAITGLQEDHKKIKNGW